MSKINSFTETVDRLVDQVNIAVEMAVKTNQSLTTQDDVVKMTIEQIDPITGDPSMYDFTIPSYNTTINKVNSIHETVDTFVKGQGKVLLNDGTYREIKTIPVAISPATILDVLVPTKFDTKNNWFFESFLFPQLTVSFDLKDKIDDRSDRVAARRVIFDNFDDIETQWFLDNIIGEDLSYYDAIQKLNVNDKKYWEDDEIQDLPLATEAYTGYFLITNKKTFEGKEWFYLDTLNYGIPSDNPVVKNIVLAIGDQLRFNNSIYKIDGIEVTEKRVRLVSMVGMDHPSINSQFEIYSPPFSTKLVKIPIGYNECNVLFLKGVNDDYNLIGDDWSQAISFYTNNLTIEDGVTTLSKYYNDNVSDFGKELEGAAKEKFIPAWFGVKPDAPVVIADDLEVSQINTQLNAALDTEEIKNSQTQIESTKTIISSLKSTIAQQKSELVGITDPLTRENLNSKISINVNDLSKRTIEHQSLVRSLSTIAYESDLITSTPKYKVRGFFKIPDGKIRKENEPAQEIIQFEVAYRYLKLDGVGNPLKSYKQTDSSLGREKRGVFSDWTIIQTPIKERIYDEVLKKYMWVHPNIGDGEEVNVNQIDIPLQKGEKVEVKIRSISEAGWPTNPHKSDWSDPVIKKFPANLAGSDQVTNILTEAIEEETTIKLEETMDAAGITTHISDSIPNPNTGDGTYFKHQAVNLAFDAPAVDIGGNKISISTVDLQSHLVNLPTKTYVTITRPPNTASSVPQLSGTLQQFFQAIVNIDPSIYDEFENILTT